MTEDIIMFSWYFYDFYSDRMLQSMSIFQTRLMRFWSIEDIHLQ